MTLTLGQLVSGVALLAFWTTTTTFAQTTRITNHGNEFYTACTPNRVPGNTACTLFIATEEDVPVDVVVRFKCVTGPGRCSKNITATKGTVETVILPNSNSLRVSANLVLGQRDAAVHIKAAPGKKVVVFVINEDTASTDSLLALPIYYSSTNTYVYFAVCAPAPINVTLTTVLSYFVIVTTQVNTTITITPTTTVSYPLFCQPSQVQRGGFTTCTFPNKGHVAAWTAQEDLTGSKIVSDKPITVLSGHQCGHVPPNTPACNHMVEHIPPVENWGFRFVLAPLLERGGDGYRFLASSDNALINVTCNNEEGMQQGSEIISLDEGEFVQRIIPTRRGFCYVEADAPVLVMHYGLGHTYDSQVTSGPFATMVPPMGQYSNNYTLVFIESEQTNNLGERLRYQPYLTLVVPRQYYQPDSILVDNVTIGSLPGTIHTASVPDQSGEVKAYIIRYKSEIGLGSHTVWHTDPRAALATVVYGFEQESAYGYLGGLELNPLSVTTFCFSVTTFEAVEEEGVARVRIQRTGSPKEAACITMETKNATAVAGRDYTYVSKACCFAAQDSETLCEVPLIDDQDCEEDEMFTAKLIPNSDQIVCNDVATVTIKDNDVVQVSLEKNHYHTSEDAGPLSVCVTVTGCGYTDPISIALVATDGTAMAGQDYGSNLVPLTLQPPTGASTTDHFCVRWPIIDDRRVEQEECFGVAVVSGDEGAHSTVVFGSPVNATVCIEDDDKEIFIMFEVDELNVNEGDGLVELCLRSSEPFPEYTILPVSFSGCSGDQCGEWDRAATGGEDYDDTESEVVFEVGTRTACVEVPLNDDDLQEKDECFIVNFSILDGPLSISKATHGPTQLKINVIENDVLYVDFINKQPNVGEGEGAVKLDVTGSIPSQCSYHVHVTTANGTAGAPADFQDGPYTVTFPAGETVVAVTIPILQDNILEGMEWFTASLVVPQDTAGLGVTSWFDSTANVTIMDNDRMTVYCDSSTYVTTEEAGNVTMTVVVDGNFAVPFNVTVTPEADSAEDPSDYIGGVITVTFQPGERARMVTFTVTDDEYAECPERFLAHLDVPEPSKGLGVVRGDPHMVTVDIRDNDGVICSVDESDSTVKVDEGVGAVRISVSCSGISSNMFMVQVQTTDNSTTGGLDYKKGPYDIEFEPGEMKKAAQVSIDDDTEPEVTESFFVSISVPETFTECGVSALSAARQIQIADNDAVSVEFDPVEYRVGEAGGVVELTLVTSSVVIRDGVVTIQTNTGNATGGVDFDSGPYIVVIPRGSTRVTVSIPIIDDDWYEGPEHFTARIETNSSSAVTPGPRNEAVISVSDNDCISFQLVEDSYCVDTRQNVASGTLEAVGRFQSPVQVFLFAQDTRSSKNINQSEATVLTFLPRQSKSQTFSSPLQQGERLVFLPLSLQSSNKMCKQVVIIDGTLQVIGDGGVPIRPSVPTSVSTNGGKTSSDMGRSPAPSPSPSSTPKPFQHHVSVQFARDTFVLLGPQPAVAVLDIALNSTALEDLCVRVVTRDGSAISSTHYQSGTYNIVIFEGTRSALVRIPVVHEYIEGSVEFYASLQSCEGSRSELTGVTFVAPSVARVVLSQQTKPTHPTCPPVDGTCYNRTPTAREACLSNDVVMLASMRKRFPQSCTYRMTAYRILKGSRLFNNTVNGKLRINIQFPRENCTKWTDGCIRLDKGVRYLIGARVRAQQHKRKSLLALLPSAFVTADVSPGMIRRVARHLSCALSNESMMTTLPSPTTTASSTPLD